jgi:hypothetical protein
MGLVVELARDIASYITDSLGTQMKQILFILRALICIANGFVWIKVKSLVSHNSKREDVLCA